MRTVYCLVCVALLSASPAATLDCPPEARQRPGNDDLVVLLDSSLSMGPVSFGPWARGYMEPARQTLTRLTDCYLKAGDFVLVATFDAETRIEVAKEIVVPERDLVTLREQIAALGPSRPRWWRSADGGVLQGEVSRPVPGAITGGSLHTDLDAALRLARRSLDRYTSPGRRHVVLIFTDGEHDPPSYLPDGRSVLDPARLAFGQGDGDAQTRHRIALVALRGTDGSGQGIDRLLAVWDPDGAQRRRGDLQVIALDPGAPDHQVDRLIEDLMTFLPMGVDLVASTPLDLGDQVRPRLDHGLVAANTTPERRRVEIARAEVGTPDGMTIPVEISPRSFVLEPGQEQVLRVHGGLGALPRGPFRAELSVVSAGAAPFQPSRLAVTGRHQGWLEVYGVHTLTLGGLAGIGLAAFVLHRRRPLWIALVWRRRDRMEVSTPRRLGVGESLRFGGRGRGSLVVDGASGHLGTVRRLSAARVVVDWAADGHPPTPLSPNVPLGVPETGDETVLFAVERTRRQLEGALAPWRPSRPAGGLDDATAPPSYDRF